MRWIVSGTLFATVVAAVAAQPPQPPARSSRDIVLQDTDAEGKVRGELSKTGWRVVRGFSWRILTQPPASDKFKPVSESSVFHTGQKFRVELEALNNLWIYVLNEGPTGEKAVVFPKAGGEHTLVNQGDTATIPASGAFVFVEPAGKEKFIVVASPKALKDLNPNELFQLEHGQNPNPAQLKVAQRQAAKREGLLRTARQNQDSVEVVERPLAEVVSEAKKDRTIGLRNIRLLPPPAAREDPAEAFAHAVINASPDANNDKPIVDEVSLKHR